MCSQPVVPVVPKEEMVSQIKAEKDISQKCRLFTKEERGKLEINGAVILDLDGTSIADQEGAGEQFRIIIDGGLGFKTAHSEKMQVAIFPLEKFFIEGSGNQDLTAQVESAKQDGMTLRKTLSLEYIDVIIPNKASILTEIIFKYRHEKGQWLFGTNHNYFYGRTKHLVRDDSEVAIVGNVDHPNHGIQIRKLGINERSQFVWVVRLVVARKEKVVNV